MKRLGKIAAGLAGGLMLNLPLRAAAPAPAAGSPTSDPYAVIAERNVFGLNPPAPSAPPPVTTPDLPKIIPQGIMGVFGNYQVLFKVAPIHPAPGEKDDYYILSEGQMQDEIEVVKIDDQKSMVTFNNHGTIQDLPLVEATGSRAPASGGPSGGPNPALTRSGMPDRGGGPHPVTPVRFGVSSAFNNNPVNPSSDAVNGQAGGAGTGGLDFNANTQGRIYQPPASTMTPEQAQIMLAAQHLKAQTEGSPTAPLFPPSAIDRQVGITPNTSDSGQ